MAPSSLVVFSKFFNLQGIYKQTSTYQNFSVFEHNGTVLWHEANTFNVSRSKWIFSPSAGSHFFFASIESSDPRPEEINKTDLDESIDRIARLVDLVPYEHVAPRAVIVESGYNNVDGIYRRQPKLYMYFPVYHSASSPLYLWHDLFRNEWVCSEVVGGNRYMWRVPSSAPRALSPSSSDVRKIEGDSRITAIRDVDSRSTRPVATSQMPKALVVFSKFSNRRGVYALSPTAHEGFPVYTDAESGLSLWHDLGDRWVCSGSVGSDVKRAWRVKSSARTPDRIDQEDVDTVLNIDRIASLAKVVPASLKKAPVAVVVKSVYTNVGGVYERQTDLHLHFPVYYSEQTTFYLWHDFWNQRWYSSSEVGGGQVSWWIPSAARALGPSTRDVSQVKGDCRITAISDELWSWRGKIDPKYVHKNSLFTDHVQLPPTCDSIGITWCGLSHAEMEVGT